MPTETTAGMVKCMPGLHVFLGTGRCECGENPRFALTPVGRSLVGKQGHTVEAYARRCANMRRNLRALQNAYDAQRECTQRWISTAHAERVQHRDTLESARNDAKYWEGVAKRDKRFVVGMLILAPTLFSALGIFLGRMSR